MEGKQTITAMEGPSYYFYLDNLEALTLWGLLKEAATHIKKHARLLLPFVLVFALPVSIFSAFSFVSQAATVRDLIRGNSLSTASFNTKSQQGTATPAAALDPSAIIGLLVFGLAKIVIASLLYSLQVASISYCVDSIYKGDGLENNPNAKPVQEIIKRLPGAIYRIFITYLHLLCILFLVILVFFIYLVGSFLVFPSHLVGYLKLLNYIVLIGLILLLSFLFMFSYTISTLEVGCYGRPALKRSVVLVTQNKFRTVAIFLLQRLVRLTLLALTSFVAPALHQANRIKPLGYICLALLILIENVYSVVLVTVFYFSLKQRENRTTTDLPKLNPPKYTALNVNEPLEV